MYIVYMVSVRFRCDFIDMGILSKIERYCDISIIFYR